MKIIWLGQAGLLMETEKGTKVMIDPYLSDSVVKVEPHNYRRKPVDDSFLKMTPDFLVFTHDHLDHYDPETAPVYLERDEKRITVLAPESAYKKARAFKNGHNYVQFDRGTVWTQDELRFTAVKATHSDPFAIGVLIEDMSERKIYYITGDTLYNKCIFNDIPDGVHALFLPINGVGNNMNKTDASAFAKKVGAKYTVPVHFGMFDELTPEGFEAENTVIPEIYKEIKIPN